ncbi:MAG: hypothetical protein K9H25_02470 [Rhodospirillum sp.]|nr:hypothetical protein [Rhodospirillum sp.]MCF8487994.1 hypothetical protein [Rhodospirillum sp.]MCF8500481.1 hypothetical protein [Rhodospirillum sp.]
MPFPMATAARAVRLVALSLPAVAVMSLGACQTTTGSVDESPRAATTSVPAKEDIVVQTEGTHQGARALNAGFTQVTGGDLRSLIAGHSYAYDHPQGARITVSYSPDGHTIGTWTHPSGMNGEFEETWVIRDGETLCGISDEGTKCGTLYRKDDLLVKIYDSGRVDKLNPVQNLATK